MALLQIAEPGQALDPHQRRIAVGIDLGTTHSLVAAVRNGVAECLPDDQGRVILPSVVHVKPERGRGFGFEAVAQAATDPANVIASVKRLMGRSLKDVADAKRLPYELVDTPGMVSVRTREGDKSPVEISAEILATLRQRAEDSFDDDVFGAVITVPAYFDDAQRQATKDAAQLAGIEVLRLINEPTAAAIAYGLDNAAEGVYAVYDLGGGTFDISILRLSAGVFEVIATGGDSALGGDDYDALVAAEIERQCGFEANSPEQKAELRALAREIKEALSATESIARNVQNTPTCSQFSLKREEFEALTDPLTQRTLKAVRKALRDAKLQPTDLQGVVMVGGSTRMPVIRRLVGELFGQTPLTNLNPDEVVALGAAIQANQLAGNNAGGDMLLLDVTPLSLGIETMGGLVERIVPRNQTIPVAMAQDFTTYQDGQTALSVHVVQGERDMVADCRSLARFTLRGIPPMAAGAARIRVTFSIDADGLLSVAAKEQMSGVEAQVQVKPSYGLADGEIARMLQESFSTAEADIAARALAQARLDVDRTVLATRSALEIDGDLLSPGERMEIDALIQAAITAKDQTEPAPIEVANKALAAGTEAFAAQRMNAGIRKALAGKSLDTV